MRLTQPSLFLGVTPAPAREYLQQVFSAGRSTYARVVVPCVGRFSGPLMALSAGYRPEQIVSSDISLFSSLIGFLASGRDPRALGAAVDVEGIPELADIVATTPDPLEHTAGVLLAQRIGSQLEASNAYQRMVLDDLRRGWRRHLTSIRAGLDLLIAPLRGIRYAVSDVFEVVEAESLDPQTILYIDPPGFAGGYTKQFASPCVIYDAPPIAEFKPKTGFAKLRALMDAGPALSLMLRARDTLGDDHGAAVWAMPAGSKIKYLVANRADEARKLAGTVVSTKPPVVADPAYPVWGDASDRIRADSVVKFTKTKREIGLYYRDLFAHTLGATDTEIFVLMWLDGKLFGTIGLHLQSALMRRKYKGQDPDDDRIFAWESFGFSSRHPHYSKHLNRLLMMCVTCQEMKQFLKSVATFVLGEPDGIRTACITKGHESKGNRGILKLIHRELRPDGRHHLIYQTEWRAGSFQDQVTAWVKKYGKEEQSNGSTSIGNG